MGEVYRARDLRLGREVAIKVLPEAFLSDRDRLARFDREARLLASLNHPNIAAIHGIEDLEVADGSGGSPAPDARRALVLEFVEGATLAERLAQGPVPLKEAVPIARQIADALDAAHSRGIVHRDLKPANVKVTPDGIVKVLDFGLAKVAGDATPDRAASATTMASTRTGFIVGTLAYMSPEQARGEAVDKRTDIWALGCVLYELLTGERAFEGVTPSDTLARVIERDPDYSRLPPNLPPSIHRLLRRCLEKDPRWRLRDIGDAGFELTEALSAPVYEAIGAGRRSPMALLSWGFGIAVAGLLAGIGLARLGPAVPDLPAALRGHVEIALPAGESFAMLSHPAAISPDGGRIVFATNTQLHAREVDRPDVLPIGGTEGARSPFFSPDGRWIGFWQGGWLKKVSVEGGVPATIAAARTLYGAHWSPDGRIVFGQGRLGVFEVSAEGGDVAQLVVPDTANGELGFQSPQLLPGGTALLYTQLSAGQNWDGAHIVVRRLDGSAPRILIEGGTDARYLPTGHLVFARGTTVLATAFNPATLSMRGSPVPVLDGVGRSQLWETGASHFSVSENGTLVYVPAGRISDRRLVWVDRNGVEEELPMPARAYMHPRLSPDGLRIVVDTIDTLDLWLYEIARGNTRRLTVEQTNLHPVWSADGRWVIFDSTQGAGLSWTEVDGRRTELLLRDPSHFLTAVSVSPDGRRAAIERFDGEGVDYDIAVLPLDGGPPEPFLATAFSERSPLFSPDGRWLAYVSDETGEDEVYVEPYPGPGAKILVSSGGGREPQWSRDGGEIFYRVGTAMMSVPVQTEPMFVARQPRRLFEGPYIREPISAHPTYDVSPDGQRFLMVKTVVPGVVARRLQIVFGWLEDVKRQVPAG